MPSEVLPQGASQNSAACPASTFKVKPWNRMDLWNRDILSLWKPCSRSYSDFICTLNAILSTVQGFGGWTLWKTVSKYPLLRHAEHLATARVLVTWAGQHMHRHGCIPVQFCRLLQTNFTKDWMIEFINFGEIWYEFLVFQHSATATGGTTPEVAPPFSSHDEPTSPMTPWLCLERSPTKESTLTLPHWHVF